MDPNEPSHKSVLPEVLEVDAGNPYRTDPPRERLNPWTSIWFRPRATVAQRLEAEDSDRPSIPLPIFAAGIDRAIERASLRNIGDKPPFDTLPFAAMLLILLIGGAIGGVLSWLLGSWLVKVTGRWLGGVGSARDLRIATGWAYVPGVFTLLLIVLPQTLLLGPEMFQSETPWLNKNPTVAWLILISFVPSLVIALWQYVILTKCVGEAHEFSAWRGLGAILLAGLLVVVPIIILALLAMGLAAVLR